MGVRDNIDYLTALCDTVTPGIRARVRGGANGVAVSTDEGLVVHVATQPAGGGGTSASYGAAFPAVGTPVGGSDGTNFVPLMFDPATGRLLVSLPAGGGGLTDAELRATPVPVSGTVTANTGLSQPLTDAQLRAAAVPVSGTFFQATQPVSAAALPLPTGASTEATLASVAAAVRAEDTAAVDADKGVGFLVIRKAAPANLSSLDGDYEFPQMANGLLWVSSVDTPMQASGEYEWQGITGAYNGLAANTPLWSLRWGSATSFLQLLRLEVLVFTSTAATTAGITERQLIIARSFTASDTGGTAATLTGNNQKLRTSDGTSLVTDMRIGAPITAGTRTLDAAPIASVVGWSGLLSTGVVIGASGSSAVGAARSTEGGGTFAKLYDETTPGARKIVLAQNEGLVVRIGAAQPAAAVQQTLVKLKWREGTRIY